MILGLRHFIDLETQFERLIWVANLNVSGFFFSYISFVFTCAVYVI